MIKTRIRLANLNGTLDVLYREMVDIEVRKRYSVSAEFAILRQRDSKPEEFTEYNAYVEFCKSKVKAELGMGRDKQ